VIVTLFLSNEINNRDFIKIINSSFRCTVPFEKILKNFHKSFIFFKHFHFSFYFILFLPRRLRKQALP